MSDARRELTRLIEGFADELAAVLETPAVSVVVFGPVAHVVTGKVERPVPRPRQIDLLVIAGTLPDSRWDRHDLIYEALLALEERRDRFAEATGWWPYLAIAMKTRDELEAIEGFPAALRAGAWVVRDADESYATWAAARARTAGAAPTPAGRGNRIYWLSAAEPVDHDLVHGLLAQAEARLLAAREATERGDHPFVVRMSQEAVELSLKAMLAGSGVEPPAWNDVGRELRDRAAALGGIDPAVVDELAMISSKLREHREPAVYGDRLDGKPPEALFSEYDARLARDWGRQAFEIALRWVHGL